jgi:tetraacyldisaccharide 4'-kinase
VFTARLRAAGLRDENGAPVSPGDFGAHRALAVCGVADPSGFAASLAELDIASEETLVFRDHQSYGPRELARIAAAAERSGASWIVTTEKDAVKLWGRVAAPVVAIRLSVEVVEPGFFAFLASRIAPADAGREAG